MSSFDDLFESSQSNDKPFDKDQWKEYKQTERKSVYALADETAQDVAENGESFRAFLDIQARFDRYSVTNALLILAQRPEATQLRTFEGWKEQGVSIKQHETHINLLEPGEEYQRDDGSMATSWKVRHVFDITQTNSRILPRPAPRPEDRALLKALIHKAPVPIQAVDELPNRMGAYYDHDQKVIFVRRGMEADDIFRSLSNELAHAELAAQNPDYARREAGFSAYCVSYLLCMRNGVDVAGYDFSRIPDSIASADPQGIRAALTEIADTARNISGRMNRALEQNKQPKTKGQVR